MAGQVADMADTGAKMFDKVQPVQLMDEMMDRQGTYVARLTTWTLQLLWVIRTCFANGEQSFQIRASTGDRRALMDHRFKITLM